MGFFSGCKNSNINSFILIIIYLNNILGNVSTSFRQHPKIIKSPLNKNTYHSIRLRNGMKVLMITNPKLDKSACALSVRIGSFNDTRHGIAHFLEHMLYLGTKDFPNESDFDNYVLNRGGYLNATTDDDITVYSFDINPEYFIKALIRFSAFFKTPTFNIELIEKELKAVQSEFDQTYLNDSSRVCQLMNNFYQKHFNIFSFGNKDELFKNAEGDGNITFQKLRDETIQFWENGYDSSFFKLVIYHRYEISKKIKRLFTPIKMRKQEIIIPNLKYDVLHEKNFSSIFNPEFTNKFIFVEPISDIHQIIIKIELPQK